MLLSVCHTLLLAQLKYPVACKENFDTTIYGKTIIDNYFWMSCTAEKEMLDFSKQQGQLTQSILEYTRNRSYRYAPGGKIRIKVAASTTR